MDQPTLRRGFYDLQPGDNVENEEGLWGSVLEEGVILWKDKTWSDARVFMAASWKHNVPYRIQRAEEVLSDCE